MKFPPRPRILDIEAYVPGASKAATQKVIKLSSNENPFGPSPVAIEAYKAAADTIHRYPESSSLELRQALAKKHGIDADRIVCGTGSDELITILCKAFCGEGDEVLYTQYGFLMYPGAALAASANPVKAPEPKQIADLDEIIDSITAKTKIIFLANPNTPTGAMIKKSDLSAFHAKLPSGVLLVLDGAYAEYVCDDDYSDGKDFVDRYDNVVMLRTFSKVYGLGGMRVGWSYSSKEIADVLNRVRGIFNLTLPTQAAAIAALQDDEYVRKTVSTNAAQRTWITAEMREMGLHVYDSAANFILFKLESDAKAANCLNFLKDRGILIRGMTAYGLSDCLRMTIGLPEDMKVVADVIREFMSHEGKNNPVIPAKAGIQMTRQHLDPVFQRDDE